MAVEGNEKQRPRRVAAGALGGEAMRRQNEDTAPLTHVSGVGIASSCPEKTVGAQG